jgi:hypothetical protein
MAPFESPDNSPTITGHLAELLDAGDELAELMEHLWKEKGGLLAFTSRSSLDPEVGGREMEVAAWEILTLAAGAGVRSCADRIVILSLYAFLGAVERIRVLGHRLAGGDWFQHGPTFEAWNLAVELTTATAALRRAAGRVATRQNVLEDLSKPVAIIPENIPAPSVAEADPAQTHGSEDERGDRAEGETRFLGLTEEEIASKLEGNRKDLAAFVRALVGKAACPYDEVAKAVWGEGAYYGPDALRQLCNRTTRLIRSGGGQFAYRSSKGATIHKDEPGCCDMGTAQRRVTVPNPCHSGVETVTSVTFDPETVTSECPREMSQRRPLAS